jgi:hypothetical protein
MSKRTPISAADLFVLIDREFRRRKARDCDTCFVPLPYRIDPVQRGGANWEIIAPARCRFGCDLLLEDLVGYFQSFYELRGNAR